MTPSGARGGLASGELLLASLAAMVLLILLVGSGLKYGEITARRVCHTQQRTLQKQIDGLASGSLDAPIEQILAQLVSAGALQGSLKPDGKSVRSVRLVDPGHGEGSYRNYVIMPGSHTVGCRIHKSAFLE